MGSTVAWIQKTTPDHVQVVADALALRRAVGLERATEWISRVVGGPARGRVIIVLACVLGLEAADQGTLGAVAAQLEGSLAISHTQLGLLASVTALVAAVATLPFGVLADRAPRTPILVASVALWSGTMIVSGASSSYTMLLISRIGLGGVIAAAGPALASLTGDLFPPRERARILGYILTGELAGTAIGFVISGAIAAALGWRAAFWALAIPGFLLAWAIHRLLPEPARGGQSRLREGATAIPGTEEAPARSPVPAETSRRTTDDGAGLRRMSLWRAIRTVLAVRTNLLLIVASALGYFFLSGIRTFALVFVRGDYGLSQAEGTLALAALVIGAVTGVLIGGRVADRLLARGSKNARIVVPAIAYVLAAVVFAPGFAVSLLAVSLPLYLLAAAALSAANPPLDAARLDVISAPLWGRAESIRTALRTLAVAAAPLVFGVVADQLGAALPTETTGSVRIPASAGAGLSQTFLIMLAPLVGAGFILWRARRSYPRDVTAASEPGERAVERGPVAPRPMSVG